MLNGVSESLIEDNVKLIPHMIKQLSAKYNTGIFEYEELYQQGLIGLAKGAASFDAGKNYKFSTYACVCIRNSILIYMRNSTRNKLPLSGSIDDKILNTEKLHLEDVLQDSFCLNDYMEVKDLIKEIIFLNGEEPVKIFCMSRLEGYTYNEIREKTGLSLYKIRRNIERVEVSIAYIRKRDRDL